MTCWLSQQQSLHALAVHSCIILPAQGFEALREKATAVTKAKNKGCCHMAMFLVIQEPNKAFKMMNFPVPFPLHFNGPTIQDR